MDSERDEVSEQELSDQEGRELPPREEMSLLSGSPQSVLSGYEGFASEGTAAADQADGAGAAAQPATADAQDVAATEGSGSVSGEETVTSENRSEQISNSNTASSQT